MALRKPLVLDANKEIQQLQAGDTLDAVVSGGDNFQLENTSGSTMIIGEAVYSGGGTNQCKKARANSSDNITIARAMGLAKEEITNSGTGTIQQAGIFETSTANWDILTGGTGGLTPNVPYFLDSATAGKITTTPPSTGWIVKLGIALSTTVLFLDIDPPIKL